MSLGVQVGLTYRSDELMDSSEVTAGMKPSGVDNHTSADTFMLAVLAPGLAALVFLTLFLLSFLMFKTGASGTGGVIGSIIHYPANNNRAEQLN
ncbi:uncharacterized protein LOC134302257 [Trichomycterus rosablanca]|uniref:uncharacterized protein LOC134302257 n=1 Tax=Trichomycterus rosablanca TaxID=2290929 RepID=UPI002F35D6E4